MNNFVKILSNKLDSAKRVIKVLRYGKDDVQTSAEIMPYGLDSNPIKDMVAMYAPTDIKGENAIIGYINKNQKAEVGEFRTFATDAQGTEKFYTWMKADGTMEIGGNTNFAVKYNELLTEYNKTKTYITTLKTATGAVATALDAIVPGTSAAFNAAMAAVQLGDFSNTKNTKIKTI